MQDRVSAGDPTRRLSRESDGHGCERGIGSEPRGVEGDSGGGVEASAAEESADEADGEDEKGGDDGGDEEACE